MSKDNDDKNKIKRIKVSPNNKNTNRKSSNPEDYKKISSKRKSPRKINKLRVLGVAILAVLVIGAAWGSAFVFASLKDVQVVTKSLLDDKTYEKTIISYSDGSKLAEAATAGKKEPIKKLDNDYVKNALISIEDYRFYEHNGVDYIGLARSAVNTILRGKKQGGSTIPMQVSKLLLTTQQQTLSRKVKDIYYALEMSKNVSKDDILLTYLNNMYVGRGFYGIEAAAKGCFSKSTPQLSLAESAMLVGATNSPEKYAPYDLAKLDGNETQSGLQNKLIFYDHTQGDGFDDPTQVELDMIDKLYDWNLITDYDTYTKLKNGEMIVRKAVQNPDAVNRAKTVLGKMKEYGYINQSQYDQACADAEKIEIKLSKNVQTVATSVEDYIYEEVINALMDQGYTKEEARNMYYNGGLRIKTTIDPKMQAQLEKQYNNTSNFPNSITDVNGVIQPQSAMVLIDYHNGQIKSLIGGRNIKGKGTLNRIKIPVQPGSAIKPLSVYTAAIDTLEMTQSSIFSDKRGGYKFAKNKKWNPSTTTPGVADMTLRKGLATSSNTVAVKVAESLGEDYDDCLDVMIDYLENFGITSVINSKTKGSSPTDRLFPSLTLGGMATGISPLEMASAYGALANEGVYIEPTVFTTITTYSGELVVKATQEEHRVVSKDVAYVMTDMLKAVVTEGTGKSASIGKMPVAGKTGTTNNKYAVWFVGYTPYYVGATYMGDDVGRKDPKTNKTIPLRPVDGSSHATAQLWSKVMGPIHDNLEVKEFKKPSGIEFFKININDGGISPFGSKAAFVEGTSPSRTSSSHQSLPNNNDNSEEEEVEPLPPSGDGDTPPTEDNNTNTDGNQNNNTTLPDNTPDNNNNGNVNGNGNGNNDAGNNNENPTPPDNTEGVGNENNTLQENVNQ